MAKHDMDVDGLETSGTRKIVVDFPSNSKKVQTEPEEKKVVEKVVTGKVVERKKPLSKKIADMFMGEDTDSVIGYILKDVLIPAAKSALYDMVTGGMEMRLYGQRKSTRSRNDRNKTWTSYGESSRSENRGDSRKDTNRVRHNFDDIILETRGEAKDVLSHLVELISSYDMATVADLYDLVGIESTFADNKYGWDELSTAHVTRVREGFLIELPRTKLLT